ncbi:MAG: hypothetical protein ABIH23_15020, partial [bacterium]
LKAAGPLPSWIVLQSFGKENVWRYPAISELRYMTYYAMTKGVKGFFFFIYQTLPHHPEGLQGLVDADLAPRDLYFEVRYLSRRLKALSATILRMTPTKPFASVPDKFDTGFYRDSDGSWCVAVVNRDLMNSRYVPIRLEEWVRPKPNRVQDIATGEETSFLWDVGPHSTRILLGPAEGTIVRFSTKEEAR